MKLFKYILVLLLPIAVFINLWRFHNMGADEYTAVGLGQTFNYVETYRGFDTTFSIFTSIGTHFSAGSEGDIGQTVIGIFEVLASPISLPIALLTDIVYNVGFFFGWIYQALGGGSKTGYTYEGLRSSSIRSTPSFPFSS